MYSEQKTTGIKAIPQYGNDEVGEFCKRHGIGQNLLNSIASVWSRYLREPITGDDVVWLLGNLPQDILR